MKRVFEGVCEFVGCVAFAVIVAMLALAWCIITPDQLSGEADLHYQACQDAGVEYAPAFGKEVR